MKSFFNNSSGFVMPLVLLAVCLLLLIGSAVLTIGVNAYIYSTHDSEQIKARSAADSGLTQALWDMNQLLRTKSINISTLPQMSIYSLPGCNAVYSYSVTDNLNDNYTVTSTGTCGCTAVKVCAVIGLQGLFSNAILSKDKIVLMPNTQVKGCNSADPFDNKFDVTIGTLSTDSDSIVLGSGTVVNGNVCVGVGGDPKVVINDGGTITGRSYSMTLEPYIPVISPPLLTDKGTGLTAKGTTITLSSGESGTYTGINLSQQSGYPGILEINGGNVVLHITGNIDMENSSEIIVRPGSSLTLYVDGNICINNSACINNQAGNVADFKLYGNSESQQSFNLMAKSSVFGTVYAPNADITVYPNSEMYGAIVGQNVTFKSGSIYYYDESVKEVRADDQGVRFVVKRWYENNF